MDESARSRDGNVVVKADELEIEIDTSSLAEALAALGVNEIIQAVRSAGDPVTPGTAAQRKRKGIASRKTFYATGHLANSIEAVQVGDAAYDIIAPADRLQDDEVMEKFEKQILQKVLTGKLEIVVDHAVDAAADDIAQVRKAASGYF
jgi:protein-tyrosine-phosphatase